MGKLVPVLLALAGLGAGIGGGLVTRPDPVDMSASSSCSELDAEHALTAEAQTPEEMENSNSLDYVKLNNQFVVPVVKDGSVTALVVLSLSLEMTSGGPELVYKREPKLRDAFLQVLFDHANTGGFDGHFTSGKNMDNLRNALRESAIKTLGAVVSDVLIVDVARQDA